MQKTTIATVLRSLSTGEPDLINERKRLGAQHPPHIVLTVSGTPVIFQNGAWSAPLGRIAVFDDAFVAANICSGIEIETVHRQNLHELILGAQGVSLNATLQRHVSRIETHNRDLRTKQDTIPAAARGALTVDAFCALAADPAIDAKIQQAERNLSAAKSIMEAFMRVAYPAAFPPGTMLGQFHNICQQRLGTSNQILAASDAVELRALLDYANRFHHDTNAAWETAAINDQELTHFCARVLSFTQRT
jgi:hypothetical protein